jgi:hypothetical protein
MQKQTSEMLLKLKREQLEKIVLENVNKLFEEDSKHLVDDYVKKVPKGKEAG